MTDPQKAALRAYVNESVTAGQMRRDHRRVIFALADIDDGDDDD